MKKVQVGMIGYGFSGESFHAPIIQSVEGLELVKIVSSNPQKVKKHLPNAEVVSEVEALFSDSTIDLVIITTPNTTHYSLTKQALLSGKHVVVEKPFVNQSHEAAILIETASQANKILSVFHNRRWDNDFLTAKACIESGAMGEICLFESHYDRYCPEVQIGWRDQKLDGSGVLYDLGPHLIDQALCLFGLPKTVFGDVFAQREHAVVDDYFHIVLGYGKLRVILHSSSMIKDRGPRFQIHGNKGSFIKYGLDSQEELLKQGKGPGDPNWGMENEENYGDLTFSAGDLNLKSKIQTLPGSYESFYKGIYESITNNTLTPVSAVDAMNTIKVIEAVKKSSEEKRVVFFLRE